MKDNITLFTISTKDERDVILKVKCLQIISVMFNFKLFCNNFGIEEKYLIAEKTND